jgi:hypothetical protein
VTKKKSVFFLNWYLKPGPSHKALVEKCASLDEGELVFNPVDERLDLEESARVQGQEVNGRKEV